MKVLLDENLPHALRRHLQPPHDVFTVSFLGWDGTKNGKLMKLIADEQFDAFVTLDAGIEFEQSSIAREFGLVVLHAESNSMEHLLPLLPELLQRLPFAGPGTVTHVGRR